jgi:hypothetical protein
MVNPQAEFNMKVYQPVIDPDNKRIAETLQPAADTANKTLATASLIHDLLPSVSTGWGADARQQGAKILSALGVSHQDLQNGILKSTRPMATRSASCSYSNPPMRSERWEPANPEM